MICPDCGGETVRVYEDVDAGPGVLMHALTTVCSSCPWGSQMCNVCGVIEGKPHQFWCDTDRTEARDQR